MVGTKTLRVNGHLISQAYSTPSLPTSGSTFSSTSLLQQLRPRRIRSLVPITRMSQSKVVELHPPDPLIAVVQVERKNNYGENLVGLLHETGFKELVILCHGFRSSKESAVMADLADVISKEEISVFRFDFAGNGESEGSFEYGNYQREADDLHSVIQYFSERNQAITTILGHSKDEEIISGGNVVLLYASKFHDVPTIINVAGRYDTKKGIAERLGKDFMEVINRDGFIDVVSKKGTALVDHNHIMKVSKT
ncbi:Alpha/beta-Hydrolases superfamily protein [Thalictrum thalictroides]|uniref:Alpha/beta-Hydrolases superfamily protein n=1 Tax=Thalictrum thalictroides TaxID=46969 RepID=A0A7J6X2A8_THATH|nr:Alpha/beta-Hydrolases superfamily protein [Thalictrum thalictroides]